jgi:hypothetical protein
LSNELLCHKNFFHNEIISFCLENGTILQTSGIKKSLFAIRYYTYKSHGLLLEELSNKPVKPETLEDLSNLEESKQTPSTHHTEFSEIGY